MSMTDAEVHAMKGTEFKYVYEDGDTIDCVVAQVDLKIGLSCVAIGRYSDRDSYDIFEGDDERTDPVEVVCHDLKKCPKDVDDVRKTLRIIRDTGEYKEGTVGSSLSSNPFGLMTECAFK